MADTPYHIKGDDPFIIYYNYNLAFPITQNFIYIGQFKWYSFFKRHTLDIIIELDIHNISYTPSEKLIIIIIIMLINKRSKL